MKYRSTSKIWYLSGNIFYIMCVLFCPTGSTAQQDRMVDSITAILPTMDVEDRIEALGDLSYRTSTSDFKASLGYGKQALNLARQTDNQSLLAKSLKNLANTYMRASRFEMALDLNEKAMKIFKSTNNMEELAGVYNNLGATYRRKGDFTKALDFFFKSLNIKDSLGGINLTSAYANIGQIYRQKGEPKKALTYFFQSLEIDEKNDDLSGMAINFSNIGTAYENQGKYDMALSYARKALAIDEKLNDKYGVAIDYNNMAEAYFGKKQYSGSFDYYQKSLTIKRKMGNQNGMAHTLQRMAKLHSDWKKHDSALVFAHKSLSILDSVDNKERKMEAHNVLSEIYSAKGDHKNAMASYKEYIKLRETIFNIAKERLASDMESKYESAKKDNTIEVQRTTIAGQQKIQVLYGILSGLLGLILLGLYHNHKKGKKRNKELQGLNEALDAKNAQNELLLREIHHRVKNNLEMVKSLIALQSAQIEDKSTKEAMLASQNRVESMGIIHQKLYQGENLGSIEMKDYFINLSEGILDSFSAEGKVEIECIMDELELDIDTAVPIGLIVNELLTNALKYAFPSGEQGLVKIFLTKDGVDTLNLQVADNGVGKKNNPAPKVKGFGRELVGMLTRQLNGTMEEDFGLGTTISFKFKLDKVA
ncbi:tetratricopeptide repeat protein [Flagellimonas pacifica]|nr:tetratricopeptide repeat protein [Allomuricauda parva]